MYSFFNIIICIIAFGLLVGCDKPEEVEEQLTSQQFLSNAMYNAMFQLQVGEKAYIRSGTPEIKSFGNQLIIDYTDHTKHLFKLVSKEGSLLPKDSLNIEQRVIRSRLSNKSGKSFDLEFANLQVKAQRDALALYERASQEIQKPDIQEFISKNLPVIKEHLVDAEELRNKLATP